MRISNESIRISDSAGITKVCFICLTYIDIFLLTFLFGFGLDLLSFTHLVWICNLRAKYLDTWHQVCTWSSSFFRYACNTFRYLLNSCWISYYFFNTSVLYEKVLSFLGIFGMSELFSFIFSFKYLHFVNSSKIHKNYSLVQKTTFNFGILI